MLVNSDRWSPSSQRCHAGGYSYKAMPRQVRPWTSCLNPRCGSRQDYDCNAAKHLLAGGLMVNTCAETVRPARACPTWHAPVTPEFPSFGCGVWSSSLGLFGAVRSLVIDVAHELWQVCMPQHLPNRAVFAGMIPIVVDRSLEQVSEVEVEGGVAYLHSRLLQCFGGECIQPGIGGLGNRAPGRPDCIERRSAGRAARGIEHVDLGQGHLSLAASKPVALLLRGKMPNAPTDAVHRRKATARLFIAETNECAVELAACKAQLQDKRMRHAHTS